MITASRLACRPFSRASGCSPQARLGEFLVGEAVSTIRMSFASPALREPPAAGRAGGYIRGRSNRRQEGTVEKAHRGFAAMDRKRQRELASRGGKTAHQKRTAHEWTAEEAREAGRKGGKAAHQRREDGKNKNSVMNAIHANTPVQNPDTETGPLRNSFDKKGIAGTG